MVGCLPGILRPWRLPRFLAAPWAVACLLREGLSEDQDRFFSREGPAEMAPFRVTGGRAPGGCRFALDQGRSCCQEGPAEEGGVLHPRSTVTVTNCSLP